LWFYFVWWKKLLISPNLFKPKQKLAFICILCGSLVNRIFGDQKAVLFGSFRLPKFQILRTLVILFCLIKKTAISANLFTPKQKLSFDCVLCGSLENRTFGDQKTILFRDFRLPIFQIIRTLWFYFVRWQKLLYHPIYLRPNKNSRSFSFCVVR
jgi:hypothetical protein